VQREASELQTNISHVTSTAILATLTRTTVARIGSVWNMGQMGQQGDQTLRRNSDILSCR
jgi:hypothetical protein